MNYRKTSYFSYFSFWKRFVLLQSWILFNSLCCVTIAPNQNCSVCNNKSSISSDEKWCTFLRTSIIMKRKLDTLFYSSIKCLTILQLFSSFWYVIYNFSGMASKIQLNQCLAFSNLNNMLRITFSVSCELFLPILNILPVAKHLMAVASFTKVLEELHFLTALLSMLCII